MNIQLKSLTLTNFKGISSLNIDFQKEVTTISGDNGTGKTTVADAFNFLLFGKDSHDNKDFNIKTLDADNNVIHKLDHEVTGVFIIDNNDISFRKVYKEKWTKAKGAEFAELTGHETLQFINDVPFQSGEYKAKIDAIIPEEKFKLLTNPFYFNNLKWDIKRRVLLGIVGEISNDDIIAKMENKDTHIVNEIIQSGKSMEESKRELAVKKKLLKSELDVIPARISEANRSMPHVENYAKIHAEIEEKTTALTVIESDIENRNDAVKKQFDKLQKKQQEKFDMQSQLRAMEAKRTEADKAKHSDIESDIATKEREFKNITQQIEEHESQISRLNNAINKITLENDNNRDKWTELNATTFTFDDKKANCPTCNRPLETDDIDAKKEEMLTYFNADKAERLKAIIDKGTENKELIAGYEKNVQSFQLSIKELKAKQAAIDAEISALRKQKNTTSDAKSAPTTEEVKLAKQIEDFKIPATPVVDIADLKEKKSAINTELDLLKEKLAGKEMVNKINARITELETQERNLSQEIASLEKTEFVITSFIQSQIKELETRLNNKFKIVKFKMFNILLNGSTEETCECLVDGVPFKDVNNAGKINAGIDIINTLSAFYGVTAPIFVDNAESINKIIHTESQLVRLVVSNDKKLVIS